MPSAQEVAQGFEDDADVDTNTTDDTTNDTDTDVDNTTDDTDKTAEADDADKTDDEDADKTADKTVTKTDDGEEYFANDNDEDETAPAASEPPAAPANFSAEDKYIIDNLPMISVRVIMADDSIKTMQVRSAAELPRDMKGIATPYEDKQFDLANAAQESRARELQTYYRNNQTQLQTQEYNKKENQSIREDIDDLQHAGEIPTFKAKPGTKAFDEDPGAKVVDEVIKFMNDRNDKYLEKYNAGGTYKHIGFAEAFELMNGKTLATSKNSAARKTAAARSNSTQGGSTKTATKAPVSGRTMAEVVREFDDFEV